MLAVLWFSLWDLPKVQVSWLLVFFWSPYLLKSPSILPPPLPQDSQNSIQCLAAGLNIFFHHLLDGASQRTVTLGFCLQAWQSIINSVRNWCLTMLFVSSCEHYLLVIWDRVSNSKICLSAFYVHVPPLPLQFFLFVIKTSVVGMTWTLDLF